MSALAALLARPIAHRGLHDAPSGVVENSLAAARAAIEKNYAIECDVQLSADGEVVVFHDEALDRLTDARGLLAEKTAAELTRLRLGGSPESIPLLRELLETVAGRVALVVELKSGFDGRLALARRVAELAASYEGPLALESFDPEPMAYLRAQRAQLGIDDVALGMVAQARYDAPDWPQLDEERRRMLASWSHFPLTRPQFLSFNADDLPHAAPMLLREGLATPVTVWTLRGASQAKHALRWADQIVFEGFLP